MTRIRLMHIVPGMGVGGLPRVVTILCETTDKSRFDVSVLCLNHIHELGERLAASGIPVIEVEHVRGRPDYLAFRKVARILRERRTDVVHTHNTQAMIDGVLGAKLARIGTIIHSDHARLYPDKRRYLVAEHVLSHFVYKVVGVSDHTSSQLARYQRIPPRKIVTIPNGIDGAKFDVTIDSAAKRRELDIPPRAPVLGLGVRLEQQKGIVYLLDALAILRQRFPGVTLVIAGTGTLEQELKQHTARLGLQANVRFVGVRLDMPELLQLFQVYVASSIWEGLPMALLEAMAAGCPIVATDVGGVSTAIQHDVNGLLVPSMQPQRLADGIGLMLSDDALRRQYAKESKRIFRERFTAEAMTRQYEALYVRNAPRRP